MYQRPDYNTAREKAGFSFSVGAGQGAYREITGIEIRDFNLDPEACITAFREGRKAVREMFGPDVALGGIGTPAISYGHVNGLGSELLFPVGGEVAHTHIYASLDEGIEALKQPVDYATAGMAPFFLEFREKLREAFPGESVGFSWGLEGPITTAYEVRGQDFFGDALERPDVAVEFLRLLTESILDFHRFLCALNGHEPVNSSGASLCDDLSSFIPPRLFPQLVIPFWDQYFSGMTTGTRYAHVENLRVEQLPFLEEIGLNFYDPSVSADLHPRLIMKHCRVPFLWRLVSFHLREMTEQDVEDFVFQSCADGANQVTTHVAETMCNPEGVAKTHAFIRAAKEARRLVEEGCPRAEIGQRVSEEGRRKLWDHWCGYKGIIRGQ